jgi:cytochrome c
MVWLIGAALVPARGREHAQTAPTQAGTTWDGVYTTAQAERGKAVYAQACAACHAADLRGDGTAPSLVEESFSFQWGDASVGELFERIRRLMPSDRPNSLPPQSYSDVVAFILQANEFPPGSRELAAEPEALNHIRITTKRP